MISKQSRNNFSVSAAAPSTPSRKAELKSTPSGASNGPNGDTPDADPDPHRVPSPDSDSDSDTDSEEEDTVDCGPAIVKPVCVTDEGTAGKESKACAEISELVNYVTPVRFKTFENALSRKRAYEMSSFDEKFATSLLKLDPIEFVKYNKFQISRIYPKGTR